MTENMRTRPTEPAPNWVGWLIYGLSVALLAWVIA